MKHVNFIFGLMTFLSLTSLGFGQGIGQLQGLYEGQITLWETGRKVNLRIALNVLEETDPTTEDLLQLVGVFTIDDEGGPYRFSKISLAMESGRLDMRYTRPNRTRILNSPSHFRLVGKLIQSSPLEFTGKVLSGFYGPIGEFSVTRTNDQTTVASIPKYSGQWAGWGNFRYGSDQIVIRVNESGTQTINPDDFEFDFTNSKIGSMSVRNQPIGFTKVYIDYLRGVMVMINGTPGREATLSLITTLDDVKGELTGVFNSSRIGQNGSFRAEPWPAKN